MTDQQDSAPSYELPASFGQERLWLLDRAGAGAAYNVHGAVRITGELRLDLVRAALETVTARHEVLRTTFEFGLDGGLRQIINPGAAVPLAESDARMSADPAAAAHAAVQRCVNEPFDLAAGPLLRAAAVRLGEREWILALAVHHIVADGWSIGILLSELAACYQRPGGEGLPALDLQYGDWAAWQREQQSLGNETATGYWRAWLDGAEPLDLPVRPGRRADPASTALTVPLRLTADVNAKLSALAQSQRATPFMVVTAALAVTLSLWCGQEDIVIATPVAGRDRVEVESLIGFFVNTLPLRIAVRADDTFRSLVGRVRQVCLDAYAHQDLPFEMIVQAAGADRASGHSPLSQVLLAMQPFPAVPWDVPGLTTELYEIPLETTTSELAVTVAEEADGTLTGQLLFAADRWDDAEARALAACFGQVLAAAASAADGPLTGLTRPDSAARRRLAGYSEPTAGPSDAPFVHELIETAADRFPDSTAVIAEDETLTYGRLDRLANGLARTLRDHGVGPEDIVGLLMPRSARLIVAMLAVLKAGAAYMPLDPAQPAGLTDDLLADARPVLLVTIRDQADALPGGLAGDGTAPPVVIADDAPAAERRAATAFPGNLGQVLYTSGSTGTPKGVMITHGGIAARMRAMQERCPVAPGDPMLVQAAMTFDMFGDQWMSPLVAGGRAVVARPGGERDPGYLADLIARHDVRAAIIVPSALHALLSQPHAAVKASSLRRIECGGEELPRQLARRVSDLLPLARLQNGYGPTEAVMSVCLHDVGPDDLRLRHIPIGCPLPGTSLHVLDRDGELLPPGAPGELYVGGPQVGRGYLGRAALTADAFVPDPFHGGQRLYRTGDRARWRPDGTLEFLGRRDGQVKIRGNRIELGTVEAALERHPLVDKAAVAVTGDQLTGRRLVAYLLSAGVPEVQELRSFLRARLPFVMVPEVFVVVPELPYSRSGKLDRSALGELRGTALSQTSAPVPPRTPAEQVLCDIWGRVLEHGEVGVCDDFYELGGNSLRAVTVFQLAQDEGLLLPLDLLFGNHTIETVTRAIEENPQLAMEQMQPFLDT